MIEQPTYFGANCIHLPQVHPMPITPKLVLTPINKPLHHMSLLTHTKITKKTHVITALRHGTLPSAIIGLSSTTNPMRQHCVQDRVSCCFRCMDYPYFGGWHKSFSVQGIVTAKHSKTEGYFHLICQLSDMIYFPTCNNVIRFFHGLV